MIKTYPTNIISQSIRLKICLFLNAKAYFVAFFFTKRKLRVFGLFLFVFSKPLATNTLTFWDFNFIHFSYRQFHQWFLCAFFVRASFWQLFLVTFRLCQKFRTKNARVKCWWNWHQDNLKWTRNFSNWFHDRGSFKYYYVCVSKIVAFIVKNINTIFFVWIV
jgi:hypothetical protein